MGFRGYIIDTVRKKLEICGVPAPTSRDRLDAILFVPAKTVTADNPFGSLSHAMSAFLQKRSCAARVYVVYFLVTIWTGGSEETL